MVTEDQIDMLKQFGSIRNCELIILTSYSFDPLFFDHMGLRQLRKGNPYAKIVVLVDSNHFDIEDCTELTGVDYEIITIPSVFHPKMFIFCGSKTLTLIIGSHNLTLAGFTHNLETTCKLENHEVALECLNCIQELLSLFLDPRNQTLLDIEQQKRKIEPENDKDIFFLNNLKASILDQAISIIHSQSFDVKEVVVISPFFSHVDELVKEIRSKIRPASIKLCIQKNNHTLDPEQVENMNYVSILEVRTKMRRRIHSKIILFKGRNDDFALIGSPNFTRAGLKEVFTVGKSNFETALLIRGKKISKLISKLDFAKITKEEIKASRVLWSFETTKEYSHHITSAHYDSFEGLRVEFLCQRELPALCIKTQSSDKTVLGTYKVNTNPGQMQILLHPRTRIPSGTTLWLCSEKGDQISNKVCVNVIISTRKFASMTKAEWIENMLTNLITSKTIGDLWRLLPLFLTSEDLESAAKTQQKRYSREYGYPSRIKTTMMSSTEIIEYLEDVFKSKRLREQEISRFDHPLPTISFQTKKTTKELIDRLVSKFAQYFEENRLQIDNSPDEYTLYVLFATKLCEVLCLTFQAIELLESLLSDSISYFEEFLETHSISDGDCSRLLSLLIWTQSEFSCRVKDDTMERIAGRSRVIPSELFDLDNTMSKAGTCLLENAKKLGLPIASETSFLMLAERVALSTLKHRTNFWKYFTPKQSMIQSLAEYYRSLIPECRDLPLEVFINATVGNEWAIVDLHKRDCYPIIGKDGLPIFSANVTAKEILENTTRIIYSGLRIASQPQASTKELGHQEFLTKILLDEVGKQLQLVSLDSKCRFAPGKIINTIRQCSPPNL